MAVSGGKVFNFSPLGVSSHHSSKTSLASGVSLLMPVLHARLLVVASTSHAIISIHPCADRVAASEIGTCRKLIVFVRFGFMLSLFPFLTGITNYM